MVSSRYVWGQDGVLRSAIWTRTRIEGWAPSKSMRRMSRKNLERYRVELGPVSLDSEHESLYAAYAAQAQGERPSTLRTFLQEDSDVDIFDSEEIAVRDPEGRLVAFSVFDQGVTSLQSLLGAYDPEHGRSSLGLWTLLLEVHLAQERGLAYHYSGYVLPGDPCMDYKLRVRGIEYLQPYTRRWVPWGDLAEADLPNMRMDRALRQVASLLRSVGADAPIRGYRYFEAPSWNSTLSRGFREPRLVVVESRPDSPIDVVIAHDPFGPHYLVGRVQRVTGHQGGDASRPVPLWLMFEPMTRVETPEEAATRALAWVRDLRR